MQHFSNADAPVHFSVLFQLQHTTCSVTARNSLSALRLTGSPHGSLPHVTAPTLASEGDGVAATYTTPLRVPPHGSSRNAAVFSSSSSPSASPPVVSPDRLNGAGGAAAAAAAAPSSGASSAVPLLSTMDKRELSKVVLRDAVYARVLDLVPGRQQVQTAVWTLSSRVIQLDGAVAVCPLPGDVANAHTFVATDEHGKLSSLSAQDAVSVRYVLRERFRELALDDDFFASLLKPYLGDRGSRGTVIEAVIDGVSYSPAR